VRTGSPGYALAEIGDRTLRILEPNTPKGGRKGVPPALAAWPGDCNCVFCNLIGATRFAIEHGMPVKEAERAAHIVLRAEHCFICLNAFPYTSGHVMIVPYAHQETLASLDQAAALEMMKLAQRTDAVLRLVYAPQGINMGLNLGQAAGAGIAAHLHMHALPRWLGDSNFMTVIGETRVLPETLDDTWERLRSGFEGVEATMPVPAPPGTG
jgi:ATP adenylyltransferase